MISPLSEVPGVVVGAMLGGERKGEPRKEEREMKLTKKSMMAVAILVAVAMVASPMSVGCNDPPPKVQETWCEYDLIAGQNYDAGLVKIYYMSQGESTWFEIYIITEDGWKISDSHVDIQIKAANFPQTKKGNFKIGKFAYKTPTTSSSTQHFYKIADKWDIDPTNCEELVIAVHAVVYKGCGEDIQEETAWAEGKEYGGNWQMYVIFPCCKYPDYPTDMTVTLKFTHPGQDSYWKITVIDPDGDLDDYENIYAGVFEGWCIDKYHTMSAGTYTVYLQDPWDYDSSGDWDLVNWILNHSDDPKYSVNEIQNAIWHITDGISVSGDAKDLADAAKAYGEGFRPSEGQWWGIVAPTPQKNIIVLDP
jgi:hypothetical protein